MASDEAFVDNFLNACCTGNVPEIKRAIANANGRLTGDILDEGLCLATDCIHPEVVAILFDAGARVTPMTVSAIAGEGLCQIPSVVREFLDHGLDPNSTLSNGYPLLNFLKDPASARELLSRGANPNLCGPNGRSALVSAIDGSIEENTILPELLLEYGAKLEPSLLFVAVGPSARYGELMTKYLLAKGLNPNTASPEFGTPLHYAVYARKLHIVKLLLEAGADVTSQAAATTKYPGSTPLQICHKSLLWSQARGHPKNQEAILRLLQFWIENNQQGKVEKCPSGLGEALHELAPATRM